MIPRTGRPNTRKEQFIRSFFFWSICLCVHVPVPVYMSVCVCVCFCLWKFALIFIVPLIFGKQHFQSSPQKGSLTEFCLGREHFSWSYFGFSVCLLTSPHPWSSLLLFFMSSYIIYGRSHQIEISS